MTWIPGISRHAAEPNPRPGSGLAIHRCGHHVSNLSPAGAADNNPRREPWAPRTTETSPGTGRKKNPARFGRGCTALRATAEAVTAKKTKLPDPIHPGDIPSEEP
jgi:hypothetical protein